MKKALALSLPLMLFLLLAGCGDTNESPKREFQTDFPLKEEAVTATLEKVGLTGTISASETTSAMDGHIRYVLRSKKSNMPSRVPTFLSWVFRL